MTTIAVLHGDQTGEELLREALRLLDPGIVGFKVETRDFDLSLEERRRTRNQTVMDAAAALRELGFGIKAATVTPEGSGDVGSPNAILRKQIDGRVIVRTGRRIPGVRPLAGVHAPISVIRMAVDDAYGAREWREGHDLDEWAFRTEKISRRTCRIVADYAFRHAQRIEAKVFGGPKFTVSPVYEGLFKEELDAAAERNPDIKYDPQLIDATYALLLATSGERLVHGAQYHTASRAVYEATLEAVAEGVKTADLGGHASTTEFTDEVIHRIKTKIDVWGSLSDIER